MELKSIDLIKSPNDPSKVRLVGEVSYDAVSQRSELYWFEVDKQYEENVSRSGNLWLLCFLPYAVTSGENIKIGLPVDPVLSKNLRKLMVIWSCWFKYPKVVSIQAPELDLSKKAPTQARTAAFFSGGVDSFFTVLKHVDHADPGVEIDDLLTVWGFDIPINKANEFATHERSLRAGANQINKRLITISTNLRETSFNKANWLRLAYGSALASTAFVLEDMFNKVLWASSGGYSDMVPEGSFVFTDPLFSSFRLEVFHDGAEFNRMQKTEFVSKFDVALRNLHVCWKHGSAVNCGRCMKCYRTMIMLELCGSLKDCATFDKDSFIVQDIAKMYFMETFDHYYAQIMRKVADMRGRQDIVRNIELASKRSKRLTWMFSVVDRLCGALVKGDMGRRISGRFKRLVLKNSIA